MANQVISFDGDEIEVIARTDGKIHLELSTRPEQTGSEPADAVLVGIVPLDAATAVELGGILQITGGAVMDQQASNRLQS